MRVCVCVQANIKENKRNKKIINLSQADSLVTLMGGFCTSMQPSPGAAETTFAEKGRQRTSVSKVTPAAPVSLSAIEIYRFMNGGKMVILLRS